MNRLPSLLAILALALTSCAADQGLQSAGASPRRLTVFAAASLTQAFEEIGNGFEAEHPGVHITYKFAGSQALRTQIEQGAPADVFASASPADMDALAGAGYVHSSSIRPLLTNRLEVILPAGNPAGLSRLQDLSRPGLKLVLAAQDVPVGKYARQALAKMDAPFGASFSKQVLANVVSEEDNVKQVVAKVELGEADAGIVYVSDAVAAPDLKTIQIPPELNVTAQYVIALVKSAREPALAAAFLDYTRSSAGQAVLARWGFGPVQ